MRKNQIDLEEIIINVKAGDIIAQECFDGGVSYDALLSNSRKSAHHLVRQSIILKLRFDLGLSLKKIGSLLNRHHTSILYCLQAMESNCNSQGMFFPCSCHESAAALRGDYSAAAQPFKAVSA